jgi:hypothetical protein
MKYGRTVATSMTAGWQASMTVHLPVTSTVSKSCPGSLTMTCHARDRPYHSHSHIHRERARVEEVRAKKEECRDRGEVRKWVADKFPEM